MSESPFSGFGTDSAFAELMDVLAPEGEAAAAEAGAPEGGSAGQPAGVDNGTGGAVGAGAPAGTPVAGVDTAADLRAGAAVTGGAAGGPAGVAGGGTVAGDGAGGAPAGPDGGALPAAWTATSAELIPRIGELSTKFEEAVTQTHQAAALTEVREEYSKYFEALEQHPRMMVGTNVPRLGGEGEETLRDTNDAREWQEALKGILVQEVRDRATRAIEDQQGFIETVHSSIKLFQDNTELIPGSKEFDIELANRFSTMAAPYELRVEGKLNGYTIPVQPIIDSLRGQLKAERAAAPAQAASPASGATQKSPPAAQPQAGIQSKAGSSGNEENYDALFGTLGIGPGFRV